MKLEASINQRGRNKRHRDVRNKTGSAMFQQQTGGFSKKGNLASNTRGVYIYICIYMDSYILDQKRGLPSRLIDPFYRRIQDAGIHFNFDLVTNEMIVYFGSYPFACIFYS